ncbi:hypothetical protein BaRGS_00009784, partial [Batillaria attramentaria]
HIICSADNLPCLTGQDLISGVVYAPFPLIACRCILLQSTSHWISSGAPPSGQFSDQDLPETYQSTQGLAQHCVHFRKLMKEGGWLVWGLLPVAFLRSQWCLRQL